MTGACVVHAGGDVIAVTENNEISRVADSQSSHRRIRIHNFASVTVSVTEK